MPRPKRAKKKKKKVRRAKLNSGKQTDGLRDYLAEAEEYAQQQAEGSAVSPGASYQDANDLKFLSLPAPDVADGGGDAQRADDAPSPNRVDPKDFPLELSRLNPRQQMAVVDLLERSNENDDRQQMEILALKVMYLEDFTELPRVTLNWITNRRKVRVIVFPNSVDRQYVCVALECTWPKGYPTEAIAPPSVDVVNVTGDMLTSAAEVAELDDAARKSLQQQRLARLHDTRLSIGHRDLTDSELQALTDRLSAIIDEQYKVVPEEVTFPLVLECEEFLVQHNTRGDMRCGQVARVWHHSECIALPLKLPCVAVISRCCA